MTEPYEPPGDLKSQRDDYARKVADRVAEESASEPEQEPVNGKVDPKFIRSCFNANELGDGLLFKAVNAGRFVFNKAMDAWMVWAIHHWAVDQMGAARAGVEKLGEILTALGTMRANTGMLWGVALSVLGVTVHKRSRDKV
jgi:hypothetical protein